MKVQNRFKRPHRLFCDDGGVGYVKTKDALCTPFEGALKIDLTAGRLLDIGKKQGNIKISLFVKAVVAALDLPFEEAIRFLRDKANVTTKHWYDVLRAAHSRSFMVAGAATDGLVADLRKAVDKAIAQGTTLAEFRKDFDRIVASHGWTGWRGEGTAAGRAWRTRIIYDTNLRVAYAAGRYAAMTKPETLEVFPYWQYHHSGAVHARPEHLSWDGLVLPADDPFWTTNYPPNGWHCGCYVTPVGEGSLRRQGKSAPDDAPELVPEMQKIGDKQITGIRGVDAGFDYNVGQEWLARTAPGRETVAAAPGMIERFVEAAIRAKIIGNAHIPTAIAPRQVAAAFGLPVKTEMRLSADTIKRHLHHGEATPEIYARIVEYAVSEGDFYVDSKGRITALVNYDGHLWQIGLKKTGKGEIYVTTVHHNRESKRKSLDMTGRKLWGK